MSIAWSDHCKRYAREQGRVLYKLTLQGKHVGQGLADWSDSCAPGMGYLFALLANAHGRLTPDQRARIAAIVAETAPNVDPEQAKP